MSNRKRTRQERIKRRQQWLNRTYNNQTILAHDRSIESMEKLLEGVTWQSFKSSSTQRRGNVTFRARVGLHMGRRVVAIMGCGQFVAFRPPPRGLYFSSLEKKLDPQSKRSGHPLEITCTSPDWGKGELIIKNHGDTDEGSTHTD